MPAESEGPMLATPPGLLPPEESDGDLSTGGLEDGSDSESEPEIPCTAGGRVPLPSDLSQCPRLQSFVHCGPHHHRAELGILGPGEIEKLHDIWSRYRDDLNCPQYQDKPEFSEEDFDTFYGIAQQVVDAMVEEYKVPMVLDQATISNTNHRGHPPHVDNLRFDSVWRNGKRVPQEQELAAARKGAYILWRADKTSYRSYSCSVALSEPSGYEGGEVQFFEKWGSRHPVESYKCAKGCGIAFCGCHENIHAVTGVKWGFRLVLLVWTRPPQVRVPEGQDHVCYFRPGTGRGCWLHTAEIRRHLARRQGREKAWVPMEQDDGCICQSCKDERGRVSWKECLLKTTPSTSAGTSPSSDRTPRQPATLCAPHGREPLPHILSEAEIRSLHGIWERHHDDLSHPRYRRKPRFSQEEFDAFNSISQKVVEAMSTSFGQKLVLDQAAVNCTNRFGHPPHADNVQFDSVWWEGRQIKQRDEVEAARAGAEVVWKASKTTSYRNYSASIALTDPEDYGGGELEFFDAWGSKKPTTSMRLPSGSGIAFCGCQRSIHAVTGVKWGFRLVLLVWTRHPDAPVPQDQHICYFRPGSGKSIWLTSEDLQSYGRALEAPPEEVPSPSVDERE